MTDASLGAIPAPRQALLELGTGSDDDLLAGLADLLPADEPWRR